MRWRRRGHHVLESTLSESGKNATCNVDDHY